ncbi:MobF family relaxase [Achromobacter ruhlandii]|uniref:MobF family relaxase n=1 Tax=Achromobacter ruhlandii TaxID=72557 RepID=UPI003B9FF2DE
MLSHKVLLRTELGQAARYYSDAADDYYAQELGASEWYGAGAEELKLSGKPVDKARLIELFSGQVEEGGVAIRRSTRSSSTNRIGIDLTFSAPKSVSIQALVGQDPAILQAHDIAVKRAVAEAEKMATARNKIDGKSTVERTGNLVVAMFRHETSREQDPQLHTHAVLLNMTRRADGKWRALRNDEIVKATKWLGATYRAELALELQKLGYELRHERDGMFELAKFNREALEEFSQRGRQVEAALSEKGLDRATATTAEKQQATMRTRRRKVTADRKDLFHEWRERAHELGLDLEKGKRPERDRHDSQASPGVAAQVAAAAASEGSARAARFAINHLLERQSIVSHDALLDVALKHAIGSARKQDVELAVSDLVKQGYLVEEEPRYQAAGDGPSQPARTATAWTEWLQARGMAPADAKERVTRALKNGSLLLVEKRYTTQTALQREREILAMAQRQRRMVKPMTQPFRLDPVLRATSLTPGQRDAVSLILTSSDGVVGVQGRAGTGKSHMLSVAVPQMEAAGYEVRAVAPYGSQVRELRNLGIQANTLASFLKTADLQLTDKTVLLLDEAGVVPVRQMHALMRLAESTGARIVMLGDTAQTKAIEAGRPFDQLINSGMETAIMADIQRQKNAELKRAVELAADGKPVESLQHIPKIVEIQDPINRRQAIADAYTALTSDERTRTIVVSGTNAARRDINRMIRVGVGLAGKGRTFSTLTRRDTTQEERRYAKYYRLGDVIRPEKDYKKTGLQQGALYSVVEIIGGNKLILKGQEGQLVEINPSSHRKLSVYEPEKTELSVGDSIKFTRNDKELDVANGDRFRVVSVGEVGFTVASASRTITLDSTLPLHLEHAYVTTIHSSQGMTEDRVLADFSTKSRTTAMDTYYVAISRPRFDTTIFTDKKEDLPAAVSRVNEKHAALDLETPWRTRMLQEIQRGRETAREREMAGASRMARDLGRDGPERQDRAAQRDRS